MGFELSGKNPINIRIAKYALAIFFTCERYINYKKKPLNERLNFIIIRLIYYQPVLSLVYPVTAAATVADEPAEISSNAAT